MSGGILPVNGDGDGKGKRQEALGNSVDNIFTNYMTSCNLDYHLLPAGYCLTRLLTAYWYC